MVIIGAIGFFIIILIIFVLSGRCGGVQYKSDPEVIQRDERQIYAGQQFILTPDEFIIPDIKSFDVSSDFIEFLPTRHMNPPDIDLINSDISRLIDDSIEESILFNFEKREIWGGAKK